MTLTPTTRTKLKELAELVAAFHAAGIPGAAFQLTVLGVGEGLHVGIVTPPSVNEPAESHGVVVPREDVREFLRTFGETLFAEGVG